MQLKIKINVPPLATLLKSQINAVVPQALNALASFTRDRLVSEAQQKLKGSVQRAYIQGLTTPDSIEVHESSAIVRLVGDFPSSIEQGSPSFSIKDAMLASGNVKKTQDGKPYVDVPFRHGTEEDSKNFSGMPKGVAYSMKQAVDKARKALVSGGMNETAARLVPTRLNRKTLGRQFTKTLNPTGTVLVKHKRGIYDDMLRIPKLYAKAIQSTNMTIRRISENSSPSSWIHPGFKAARLFDSVGSEVQKISSQLVLDIIKKAGIDK